MSSPFELLKEEFIALRSEICQSISKQHHITLSGYGVTAATFGYLAGMKNSFWEGLFIIPFILLAMSSLWTVECNRMVRAGYYIGCILWPELKSSVSYNGRADWEAWIRKSENVPQKFGAVQHYMQMYVVVYVPILISLVSMIVASKCFWEKSRILTAIVWLVLFILWLFLFIRIRKITNLSEIKWDEDNKSVAEQGHSL